MSTPGDGQDDRPPPGRDASGKPILFRVDYEAGHGIGSTKHQINEGIVDGWSFLLWQFGDPKFQPQD